MNLQLRKDALEHRERSNELKENVFNYINLKKDSNISVAKTNDVFLDNTVGSAKLNVQIIEDMTLEKRIFNAIKEIFNANKGEIQKSKLILHDISIILPLYSLDYKDEKNKKITILYSIVQL